METPVAEAARTVLRQLAEAVLHETPDVLRGDDARATHDLRVALRRLRTLLRIMRPCYRRQPYRRIRRELRSLGRRLGSVRDADVHLAALRSALGGATRDEADGIAHAIAALHERRRHSLARFAIELSQFDRAHLLAFIESARGEQPLGKFVPKVLARQLRRFLTAFEEGLSAESDVRLHAARIAGKRLRYTLEAVRTLAPEHVRPALRSLELVQDRLGTLIDIANFLALYEELLRALDPGDARAHGLRARIDACELQRRRVLAELHARWNATPSYPAELTELISSALGSLSASA
ncbi:MAG TPA: CHAD domain-containing protein [Candidatus Acidoferrales bacterium]|nr:CHAD domain-containing protein [Candidatus Acidoferrales bacterium]